MYDYSTLLEINKLYDNEWGLEQRDVDKVNDIIAHIEKTRSTTLPKEGDNIIAEDTVLMQGWTVDGIFTAGRLGANTCFFGSACIWKEEDGIGCSISGGPFKDLPTDKFVYVGKATKTFWTWGSVGARGGAAIYFTAEVSNWLYLPVEKCADKPDFPSQSALNFSGCGPRCTMIVKSCFSDDNCLDNIGRAIAKVKKCADAGYLDDFLNACYDNPNYHKMNWHNKIRAVAKMISDRSQGFSLRFVKSAFQEVV